MRLLGNTPASVNLVLEAPDQNPGHLWRLVLPVALVLLVLGASMALSSWSSSFAAGARNVPGWVVYMTKAICFVASEPKCISPNLQPLPSMIHGASSAGTLATSRSLVTQARRNPHAWK